MTLVRGDEVRNLYKYDIREEMSLRICINMTLVRGDDFRNLNKYDISKRR